MKKICIWTINNDSLNKNTISLKLHNITEKIIIINRVQLLGGGNNNTCTLFYTSIVDNTQYLFTSIAIIHFKRSHIENKFRQLDKFTFNLSFFFNEIFSLQSSFSN